MNKKIEYISIDRIREISRQNSQIDIDKRLNRLVEEIERQAKLGLFNLKTSLVINMNKDKVIDIETKDYIEKHFKKLRNKGFKVSYTLNLNFFNIEILWDKKND